jgi:hypothetical protein
LELLSILTTLFSSFPKTKTFGISTPSTLEVSLFFELCITSIISELGELIIDPFGGSGTTAKVANDLGFDSLIFDIDKTYCEIIKKRINASLS